MPAVGPPAFVSKLSIVRASSEDRIQEGLCGELKRPPPPELAGNEYAGRYMEHAAQCAGVIRADLSLTTKGFGDMAARFEYGDQVSVGLAGVVQKKRENLGRSRLVRRQGVAAVVVLDE